jgi:hypothetical protein
MLTLTLHNASALLEEEGIRVGWRDYAIAAGLDLLLITWIGWLVSVVVRAVLP